MWDGSKMQGMRENTGNCKKVDYEYIFWDIRKLGNEGGGVGKWEV